MKRQYTICTEHSFVIRKEDKGSCPRCNGDRNLIEVVAADDLKEEFSCSIHGVNTAIVRLDLTPLKCGAVSGYGDVCKEPLEIVLPWEDNVRYAQRKF